MVGIVIVSHSAKIAEGVRDLAAQMAGDGAKIIPAGGLESGEIGTDAVRIMEAIQKADSGDGVVVMVDMGSSILSTETAMAMLPDEMKGRVKIADAPIVEGSMGAAVCASGNAGISEVISAAEEAKEMKKLQ